MRFNNTKFVESRKSLCFHFMYSFFHPLHSATRIAWLTAPVPSSTLYSPPAPIGLCNPDKRVVAGDGFHADISTHVCINVVKGSREYREAWRIRKRKISRKK